MPRPNAPRVISQEPNLARRIAFERQRRGWSYDGTANRLTLVGCPIAGSAIFKIEKGDPPRRISVDELCAFATVFETTVHELLTPLELIFETQAMSVLVGIGEAQNGLYKAAAELLAAVRAISGLPEGSRRKLKEYLETAYMRMDIVPVAGVEDDVQEAFAELMRAIMEPVGG